MPIKLNVNNVATTVDVSPDMPLLWVLRDVLNLKGSKYGCGIGVCGACTVLVGGRAVRSCMTHVGSVTEPGITTIEGLSADGVHPVQAAWEALDVPQCGYCQAGQIMSAAALLARTPHPTRRGDRYGHERQPLPLRNVYAHPASHSRSSQCGRRRQHQANGRPSHAASTGDHFCR